MAVLRGEEPPEELNRLLVGMTAVHQLRELVGARVNLQSQDNDPAAVVAGNIVGG
jgi:hypothetical protein